MLVVDGFLEAVVEEAAQPSMGLAWEGGGCLLPGEGAGEGGMLVQPVPSHFPGGQASESSCCGWGWSGCFFFWEAQKERHSRAKGASGNQPA